MLGMSHSKEVCQVLKEEFSGWELCSGLVKASQNLSFWLFLVKDSKGLKLQQSLLQGQKQIPAGFGSHIPPVGQERECFWSLRLKYFLLDVEGQVMWAETRRAEKPSGEGSALLGVCSPGWNRGRNVWGEDFSMGTYSYICFLTHTYPKSLFQWCLFVCFPVIIFR